MTHRRVVLLTLLMMCLFVAPLAFGDKSKDKQAPPAQKPAQKPAPQPQAAPSIHKATPAVQPSSIHAPHNETGVHPSSNGNGARAGESRDAHGTFGSQGKKVSGQSSPRDSTRLTPRQPSREELTSRLKKVPDAHERSSALGSVRDERGRFLRHSEAVHFRPEDRPLLRRVTIVPSTYHYRRSVFYDSYGWRAPGYVYRLSPRYGLWDATFLAFSLDHIANDQYARMLYQHRNEAEIQQWMQDTD